MMLYQTRKSSRKIIAVFIVVLMLIGSVAFEPSGIYAAEAGQGDVAQPVIAVENGGIKVIEADELSETEKLADAEPTEPEAADDPEGSSEAEAALEAAPGEADDTSGPTTPEAANKPEGSSETETAFEAAPGEPDDTSDSALGVSQEAIGTDEQPSVMSLSLLSTTAAIDFTYTVSGTNATITGYTGSAPDVVIPDTIDGYAVTAIGSYAFQDNQVICTVTLPSGMETIGNYAFLNCSSLTNLTIPGGVTTIGSGSFENCANLTSIDVDATNQSYSSIDGVLFNKEKSVLIAYPAGIYSGEYTIPQGVTSIGYKAFIGCTNLAGVAIPNSVTSIDSYAFDGCTSLTNLTIPDSVTSIGYYAFSGSGLTNLIIPNSVTSIGHYTFYDCTSLTNLTIPDSVTRIDSYAFYYCTSLTNLTIPDSVTRIESHAFFGSGLTSITIPGSVREIVYGAFGYCANLTNITVDATNQSYSSVDGVLFNKDKSVLIAYPAGISSGEYTIPQGVTSIVEDAFIGCTNLAGVAIPNSVTQIGISAFAHCTNLTGVAIPSSVTLIGSWAFDECGLTSVVIPDSVISIGNHAFASCSSLTRVTIPDSVISIGSYAFEGCIRLSHATFNGNAPSSFGVGVFRDTAGLTIHYYEGKTGWTSPKWNGYRTVMIGAPVHIPVTSITGIPSTAAVKTPLALSGTVNPSDATNKTIVWSVVNAGSTGATIISDSALHTTAAGAAISSSALYTTAAGSVTVRATIVDGISAGTNYTQDFVIVVKADSAASYTITYNANGGSGAPAAQTKTPGNALLLSSTVPARAGYTFLGWAAGSATASVQYQPRMLFVTDANTTLYAIWAVNEQTVVKIGSVSAAKGSTVKVPVTITNSPGISSAILEFNFPAELTLITFEGTGGMPFEAGDFTTGSGVGIITLMEDAGYTNELLTTLVFAVSDNATEGMKAITINMANESVSLGDVEGFYDIQFTPVSGSVTVSNVKVGDVNGDGKITATDLTYMKRAIVKRPGFVQNAAMDVNRDGEITATDLTYLKRAIVNRPGFVL